MASRFADLKPQTMIIVAPPGAGKTTRVPPILLRQVSGRILVLEPRRMAAVAAVHRTAEEQGWEVGREIGYQIRFENRTSSETRLIFMTEAMLSRHMLRDPELRGVDVVILDEFHERSLDVDIAISLLKELQDLGRQIHIIVMSATLQTEKLSRYLGEAPVVQIESPQYPLTLHHLQRSQHLMADPSFYETVEKTIQQAARVEQGDILVFLPGAGEIETLRRRIAQTPLSSSLEIRVLHGSLPLADQQRALKKSQRRKLILSTNIAESSVTVEGVQCVIDSGLAKVMWQNRTSGFSQLQLTRIARDNADQRAGRAARQGPGVCYRLWSASEEKAMAQTLPPEIHRVELMGAVLTLAAHGVSNLERFSWFERPEPRHLQASILELQRLEALDDSLQLTQRGRQMAELPAEPRLAHLLLQGREMGIPVSAAHIGALLSEPDLFRAEHWESYLPLQYECDVRLRLEVFLEWENRDRHVDVDPIRATRVRQAARQMAQALTGSRSEMRNERLDERTLKSLLLSAFPDRICRRRGQSPRGRMVGGRGVRLIDSSVVRTSEFFIALEGRERLGDPETLVTLACGFSRDDLLSHFGDRVEWNTELIFDEEKEKFSIQKARRIFDLMIEDPVQSVPASEELAPVMADFLSSHLDWVTKRNAGLDEWIKRWRFFHKHSGVVETELTEEIIHSAFAAAVMGRKSLGEVLKQNLVTYFEMGFSQELVGRFQRGVPREIHWPGGRKSPIEWDEAGEPFTQVRLQDAFGLKETPALMGGQIRLRIFLLGPNYRPVQVTSDIESFWDNGYPEVRKELRARYPKHSWPENPRQVVPPFQKKPRS